jgi:hypothetical protein
MLVKAQSQDPVNEIIKEVDGKMSANLWQMWRYIDLIKE